MRPRYVALPPLAALALALAAAAPAPAAVVQLTPAAAPPGARAHVAGAGFVPGRPVLVRLAGRTVAAGATGGDGTFVLPVPISGALQARTRPVQVVNGGVTLSPSLRIMDGRPAGAPVSVASSDGVRLAMAPTVAGPGSSVLIRAAGLPANARVTFALTGGPRAVVRASRRGNARARLTLPLLRTGAGLALVRYRGSALAVSTYALPTGVTVPALPPPSRAVPLLAAAGDIACRPGQARTPNTCHQAGTAALLGPIAADVVAPLGDEQYERGTAAEFSSYDSTWGPFVDRERPTVGNHEYNTTGALPYYAYFGARAGAPGRGYYSYDVGAWHVAVLNSNCTFVGCNPGNQQLAWLRADLAAHPAACTLAYWHHPRFTSANSFGGTLVVAPFWQALYDAGADVVLVGHDHDYERFGLQSPSGGADPRAGIREFVVGTGGRSRSRFVRVLPNSEVRDNTSFGVLSLALAPRSYTWRFLPEAGAAFTDSGSTVCHP